MIYATWRETRVQMVHLSGNQEYSMTQGQKKEIKVARENRTVTVMIIGIYKWFAFLSTVYLFFCSSYSVSLPFTLLSE